RTRGSATPKLRSAAAKNQNNQRKTAGRKSKQNKSMKRILNITIMAFALMTIAGSAFGQAVIHIEGSTAFRPAATAGIMDIFTPGTVYCAYDSSSTTYKAGAAIFYGTLASNGHNVYVKTFWTGSMAGVYDLSNRTIITKWIATPASPPPGGGV